MKSDTITFKNITCHGNLDTATGKLCWPSGLARARVSHVCCSEAQASELDQAGKQVIKFHVTSSSQVPVANTSDCCRDCLTRGRHRILLIFCDTNFTLRAAIFENM